MGQSTEIDKGDVLYCTVRTTSRGPRLNDSEAGIKYRTLLGRSARECARVRETHLKGVARAEVVLCSRYVRTYLLASTTATDDASISIARRNLRARHGEHHLKHSDISLR